MFSNWPTPQVTATSSRFLKSANTTPSFSYIAAGPCDDVAAVRLYQAEFSLEAVR